jgi:hypothetical protein
MTIEDPTTTERLMDVRLLSQAVRDDILRVPPWPGLSVTAGRVASLLDAIDGLDEVLQHGEQIPVQWARGR